ncbi:MAG: hypothetical protein QG657_1721, partial [Acidobacteriota bacterium]|nr:hypothetical protein [Acidobacteriota bacterium]
MKKDKTSATKAPRRQEFFYNKPLGVPLCLRAFVAIFMVMIFLSGSFLLYGHGIQLTIVKKYPCIIVNAKYHGSQGLAHADVIVRFEKEKKEFQVGKTDKNGIFCFYPDQTG